MSGNGEDEHERDLAATEQVDASRFRVLFNPEARLILSHRGRDYEISPQTRVFVIGRSPECDLVVDSGPTSRKHARIIYRTGKFVLIDQSKNGTYLRQAGGVEVYLLGEEEHPLTTAGLIGLGQTTGSPSDDHIRYRCERCSPELL